jgi:hypothetical protein
MGLLDWLRRPPPQVSAELWERTLTGLPFLDALAVDEKKKLKTLVEAFLGEKEFGAAGGLALSDEICVSIAAQGCLPVLELGLAAYRDWVGIVVYPDEFVVSRRIEDEDGVVHEFDDVLSGEAWAGGPVIVSWHDAAMAGEGYNVVIHEFAHKLDMLNGEADGVPALHSGMTRAAWEETFLAAYDDFCARVDDGEDTIIDPYASDDPAEFFAVVSEHFFETPDVVATEYPALYDLLKRYYRQDPLARPMRTGGDYR